MAPTEDGDVVQALQARGLRPTPARRQLMAQLASRRDHPTADQLAGALRSRGERFGVATLYQNLNRLHESGVIGRIQGTDGLMHFDANTARHDHLLCRHCGRIVDVEIGPLPERIALPHCPRTGEPFHDWGLQDIQVELKGVCPDCR